MFGLGPTEAPAPETCADWRRYACAVSTDPLDDESPQALRTWLAREYLMRLPTAYARHDSVAHYAIGASRDDAGPTFGGGNGLENRWFIGGAPSESLRTGASETRVPLAFMEGMTVVAGGFGARDRASFGGTVDVELRRGTPTHEVEAYVWGGLTADPRRRTVASGDYSLRRLGVAAGPDTAATLVATGPLPDIARGRTWYAAGIAPSLLAVDFAWQASRLVDADGNDVPDGLPGDLVLDPVLATSARTLDYVVPAMARFGWERGAHALELTAIGQATRDAFFFQNATLQAAGIDRTALVADGIASYRGRWESTRVRAMIAWHRSVREESAHDPAAASVPQLRTAYVPAMLPEDAALSEACRDDDLDDNFLPCPIPFGFFLSGGVGALTDTTGDRTSATADLARRVSTRNVIRAGLAFEDTRLVHTQRFTGGELQASLFEGIDRARTYYQAGDCTMHSVEEEPGPCTLVSSVDLRYRTRYTAAYVEDTFAMSDRVQVNGGVRWELMWVGGKLHLSDQLSPRLGIVVTPLGKGRSRVFATMSKTFLYLPAGLGPTLLERAPTATIRELTLAGETFVSRVTDPGATVPVADGIQGASQQEVTLGGELALEKTLRLAAWLQGRWIERGLETTGAGFDNPGRDGGPAARRQSELYAIELSTSPKGKLALRAGWLWSRTTGNWAGAFDPRQGAVLYAGSDFDNRGVHGNLDGILALSPGHRTYIEGIRRGAFAGIALEAAARFTVASGRSTSILADGIEGPVHLLPRGSEGRLPMASSVNVRIAARVAGMDLYLDIANALNRREALAVDELYAASRVGVLPIVNGEREDLVWAKAESENVAQPLARRTAYRLPTQFQAPLSATFGLRRRF